MEGIVINFSCSIIYVVVVMVLYMMPSCASYIALTKHTH
jgi:hypothetical protein